MDSSSNQISSSSPRICKYDVFLSFRGEDTRNGFTDHLCAHLMRKGIFAFKDEKKLQKGEPIYSQLLQAIRDSRVSIVVFSKDYAASKWCLDEMAAIAECKKEFGNDYTVFPIFYDVDPSHVRNQNGVYGEAFAEHGNNFKNVPGKVDRWKTAMQGLANSNGWDIRNKKEFGEIEKIVQEVITKMDHKFSGFADDLVGIQSRVEVSKNLLKLSSPDDEFRVLGIWGMGGIGKTTLAAALYDRVSYQFDACCFIEDVRKYSDDPIAVQKQILRQITADNTDLDTYSAPKISDYVRRTLSSIKVLVALDNVDQSEQLQKLAIYPELLGAGSRIIITTRDRHILIGYRGCEVYEVPLLTHDEARKLFYRKAFKNGGPSSRVEGLIPEVLNYADGLPLAITVLGNFLYSRDATQWRDALDRLQENPEEDIMKVLQISFEELEPIEKEIFLDSACFFEGKEKDYVNEVLDCCGLNPGIGIPVMMDKSLMTIIDQNIHVHKLLQELGKKIVRGNFPEDPELWSRLWLYRDFCQVMTTEPETIQVKALVLDQEEDDSLRTPLRAEEFSKMRDLRLLILYHSNFSGNLKFLSNKLRYLSWHGYPFTCLPSSFGPHKLVELNMPSSSIQRLWDGIKHLPYLRRVDLSHSKDLETTPDFSETSNLKQLHLTGCKNLSRVHPSIARLPEPCLVECLRNCSNLLGLLDRDCESNLVRSENFLDLSTGCTNLWPAGAGAGAGPSIN